MWTYFAEHIEPARRATESGRLPASLMASRLAPGEKPASAWWSGYYIGCQAAAGDGDLGPEHVRFRPRNWTIYDAEDRWPMF